MRLGRLMAEDQAVIADARREAALRLHRLLADRNGEIGPQAQFAARRIGQGEGAAADFLARTVEENIGRLQHRRFFAGIAARREARPGSRRPARPAPRCRCCVVIGKGRHQRFLPACLLMSATRLSRLTLTCAWRVAHPGGAAFHRFRQLGAQRQIFQRDFAPGPLVAAFDHGDGRAALVGIFELVAESCRCRHRLRRAGRRRAAPRTIRKLAAASALSNTVTTTSGAQFAARNAARRQRRRSGG